MNAAATRGLSTEHPGRRRYYGGADKHLTLPELGALLIIAGRSAGFKVETEAACGSKGRIDCAWYRRDCEDLVVVIFFSSSRF